MKLLPGAVGVLLLLALLTWLLLRGIDTNAPAYAATLRAFDDSHSPRPLSTATSCRPRRPASQLQLTRYGLEGNGGRGHPAPFPTRETEGLDAGPADRLAAAVTRPEEELTERFKSNNALLQNSLSYVGLLSTSPAFGAQDAAPQPAHWQRRSSI